MSKEFRCFYLRNGNSIRGAIIWNMNGDISWSMCHPSDRSSFSRETAWELALARLEANRKSVLKLGPGNPRIIDHVLRRVASMGHDPVYPDSLRRAALKALRAREERPLPNEAVTS